MDRDDRRRYFVVGSVIYEVVTPLFRQRLENDYKNRGFGSLQTFADSKPIIHILFHLRHTNVWCCQDKNNCRSRASLPLNYNQWDLLFTQVNPAIRNHLCHCQYTANPVQLNDLDLTLAGLILLNCCNLRPVEEIAIKGLRKFKNNYLSHNINGRITQTEYNIVWPELTRLFLQLDNTKQDDLTRIENRPLDGSLCAKYCIELLDVRKKLEEMNDCIQQIVQGINPLVHNMDTSVQGINILVHSMDASVQGNSVLLQGINTGIQDMNMFNIEDKPVQYKPIKCYSSDRLTRKAMAVKNLPHLVELSQLKFGFTGTLKVVLEEDGMEVEEEDYFSTLPPNTKLMILNEEQTWTPAHTVGSTTSSCTSLSTVTENNSISNETMLGVISSLKDKCNAKRKAAYAVGSSSEKKQKNASTVKLSPGWKHYSFNKGDYLHVRSRKDKPLPTTDMIFASNLDYDSALRRMEDLYFKNGKSLKGKLTQMDTKLGSNKGELSREGFSPKTVLEDSGTQKAKLYLLTKNKIPDLLALTCSESDEEEDENQNMLPIIFRPNVQNVNKPATITTTTSTVDQNVQITPTSSIRTFTVHADTPTVTMQMPNSYRICTVCVDREVDAVILPCVHSLCYTCALHFKENLQPCPMCRTIIAEVKSIYFN